MRILINTKPNKLELYARSTGTQFLPLKSLEASEDAVAVVVQGASFRDDLEVAVGLNVPVVVVAGSDNEKGQECAREAVRWGIPEACVLLKKGGKVCSLDGREVAEAAKGIGVRAVLRAAEYALENNLYPEPLIWREEEEVAVEEEPVVFKEPEPTKPEPPKREEGPKPPQPKQQSNVVRFAKPTDTKLRIEGLLEMSRRVAVVLKATPDAESGRAAKDLAEKLSGVHLEISDAPRSYTFYGETPEKASETGRYLACTGSAFVGTSYTSAEWLVVELDAAILTEMPDLVDAIYNKAEKVIQAVGSFNEGQTAVKTWLDSGWRLDAVVPSAGYEQFRSVFGKIVFPNAAALASQFA